MPLFKRIVIAHEVCRTRSSLRALAKQSSGFKVAGLLRYARNDGLRELLQRICVQLVMLIIATAAITGCGFHLRGMVDIPSWLNDVSITVQHANRDLKPLLKDQLEAYNVQVNPDPALARYWLIIVQDSVQQHITSISSSTTPRQYQLIYTVRFKLQGSRGEDIIPLSSVVVTRQATINSDRLLGSNDEEALLNSEMRREAASQILNRLSRSTPNIVQKKPRRNHAD